jgi:hypothetical protein
MAPPSLITRVVLCLSTASAWNECAFPQVGYFALDEGAGISYAYAIAAMNGNMYSGGYTKGNFAFVGVTADADVNPAAGSPIWGDTTSDVQSLYIAEVSSGGSMTKAWLFQGSAIQVGTIGHGAQTNSIDASSGMHAMLDKQHIAVKGGFRQLLELPDGTLWSSVARVNTKDQVPFVMSIDVTSTQGVGNGTTGWAKLMDEDYAGGASVYSVDGDTSGNMIVTYKGCDDYDATATSYDAYGRPVVGAAVNCTEYVSKLSAADGTEVWKYEIPTALYSCRTTTDGSVFCGWSMSASAGTLDFGNGITVVSEDTRVGIVKYDTNGMAQWAKATANTGFSDLAVSNGGTLLAVVGSPGGYGSTAVLSRIDTSSGNEGNVLWSDPGGVGSHGFRGVEVTDDDAEVFAFGQLSGSSETLTDANGRTVTLGSRGSYEVFVLAYDASDGSGKYAMDGGGTGMEYFFAMASDPDTHEVYVGGTTRSEYITWGDVTRKNVMYNGQPGANNPDTSSAVGSSKAFVVKLSSTATTPSCLTTCNSAFPLQASDVANGYCYINRHCYAHGASSPYSGDECTKCDANDPMQWSAPDTSAHCFIDGACVASGAHAQVSSGYSTVDDACLHCDPSISSTAYSSVAGCELPSTFVAACYTDSGSLVISLDDMMAENETNHMTIASMQTDNARLLADVDSRDTRITILQTELDVSKDDEGDSAGVMALIIIVCILLVITSLTLVFLVMQEKKGKAVFAPVAGTPVVTNVPVGSPVDNATYGKGSDAPPAGGAAAW